MTRSTPHTDWATTTAAQASTRLQTELASAQQALIEALAEGDHSRSDSALAEMRLALRASDPTTPARDEALSAVEALAVKLHDGYRIHEDTRAAA